MNLPSQFCAEVVEIDVTAEHYEQHPKLMQADATQQYLFDLYNQNVEECESKCLKVINGRVVFK